MKLAYMNVGKLYQRRKKLLVTWIWYGMHWLCLHFT